METTCNRSSNNNHLILKLSRLFPSSFTSCNFRTLVPDVIVPHPHSSSKIHQHPPPPSSSSSSNSVLPNNHYNTTTNACSETSLLLPRPSSHKSSHPSNLLKRGRGNSNTITNNAHLNHRLTSSSSYSSWFTTTHDDHESDTFFSLSSHSGLVGDSFRLRSAACSRRFSQEMKRIDERGSSRSFISVNTRKTAASPIPDDQISAQIYYGGGCPDRHHSSFRKLQRTSKMNRRKAKRSKSSSLNHGRSLEWNNPMMEESYAVEKRSKDPRADFRASMVEMIVEKQMFGERDLEKLLECFLSLNSESYHRIIIQVFTEICETLFSN